MKKLPMMTRIHKESYTITNDMIILQFRESFVRSLLFGMSLNMLKSGPKEQSTNNSTRKPVDHKHKEKEGSTRNISQRYTDCYEKGREKQSREVNYATTKKIKKLLF
jgi:hypothetical protein